MSATTPPDDPCALVKIQLPSGCSIRFHAPHATVQCENSFQTITLYGICNAAQKGFNKNLAFFKFSDFLKHIWFESSCTKAYAKRDTVDLVCQTHDQVNKTYTFKMHKTTSYQKGYQTVILKVNDLLKAFYIPQNCDGSTLSVKDQTLNVMCYQNNEKVAKSFSVIMPTQSLTDAPLLKDPYVLLLLKDQLYALMLPDGCMGDSAFFENNILNVTCLSSNSEKNFAKDDRGRAGKEVQNSLVFDEKFLEKKHIFLNIQGHLTRFDTTDLCEKPTIEHQEMGNLSIRCETAQKSPVDLPFQSGLFQQNQWVGLQKCTLLMQNNQVTSICNLASVKNVLPKTCRQETVTLMNGRLDVLCETDDGRLLTNQLMVTCDCLGAPIDLRRYENQNGRLVRK